MNRLVSASRQLCRSFSVVANAEKSPLETFRARLYYQSKKRGILENDVIVGGFADKELKNLNEAELKDYDVLINGDTNEWDLFYYLSGKNEPPSEIAQNSAFKKIKQFVDAKRNA